MRSNHHKWILPKGVDELLPPQAEQFASLQQKLLKIFYSYGYELFNPPVVEFLHSLVIDHTDKLEEAIGKFSDKSSGESLGIRADFTPQAARVEASKLQHNRPNRICYCGDIFRNHQEDYEFRNQVQAGVELFGDKSLASDKEVIFLLIDCLSRLSKKKIVLDLGHAQLWRCLTRLAGFSPQEKDHYFTILQAKEGDHITAFIRERQVPVKIRDFLLQLPYLCGDERVVREAKKLAQPIENKELRRIISSIQSIVNVLKDVDQCKLFLDLGEMPGSSYSYHNGLVFGAYFEDKPQCFAKGGRYDSIAGNYGPARAATGFSIDLRSFFHFVAAPPKQVNSIFAPFYPEDRALQQAVQDLRSQGKRVICALNARQNAVFLGCDKRLIKEKKKWLVKPLVGSR